ncbi:MAG: dihydrodipicolinate synthase family protein [Spirochaetes bacterium]|nr:dihydrodipicolinate synthase family protein [Spirochaetota bacterium]
MQVQNLPSEILTTLRGGTVIPAIPLALDARRQYDMKRQKALVRYYLDAGAGGLAVGVHTTQFEIREPKFDLFEPVLSSVSHMMDEHAKIRGIHPIKIGGICGRTDQALKEAQFLRTHGFHAGLISLSAFPNDPIETLLVHCRKVAEVIPLFGFYLQPSVGGRILPYEFWVRFAEIENVVGVKIAPFNRYQTLDVVRAICDAGRENEIALYTGNDDHILLDLVTEYRIHGTNASEKVRKVRIVGGLLGQWSVWTKKAVEHHRWARELARTGSPIPQEYLTLAEELTDANGAIFDVAHRFAGCIAGIHEVLRRQGFLEGTWCLNPDETLSPGQSEEISRIYRSYPHLTDDDFVQAHLSEWFK